MEESRTQRVQQLLRRLGKAVHGTVVRSDEVQSCLRELHDAGWEAVMLFEASLACRPSGNGLEVEDASMHFHVDPSPARVTYRIDARDAELLSGLGISPSRHRSRPSQRHLPEPDDESDR
jgi:hypothetical protein